MLRLARKLPPFVALVLLTAACGRGGGGGQPAQHAAPSAPISAERAATGTSKPTILLVHGAFAESASWNGVIRILQDHGYTTIAAANPLRSVSGDADFVANILGTIHGPIVLVGHSYGGSVITDAVRGNAAVKALVFVSGLAPDEGESAADLTGRFPGSTLGETLRTVPLADGTTDLYIRPDRYHQQFEADVPAAQAALDASTQRPFRDVAVKERSGPPAWKTIPSWFVFASLDRNLPVALHRFMAERAKAREVVEVPGASHSVQVSHPDTVAQMIMHAAAARPT